MNEFMIPKLELRILDKFNEGDKQSPRMRPVDYQSLQQNSSKYRMKS